MPKRAAGVALVVGLLGCGAPATETTMPPVTPRPHAGVALDPASERGAWPAREVIVGGILLGYEQPTAWRPRMKVTSRVVGFGNGTQGFLYGHDRHRTHGVVVADITAATFHQDWGDPRAPAARNAAEFLDNLVAVSLAPGRHAYEVADGRRTNLGSLRAISARVTADPETHYAFLEMDPSSHVLDLGVSQQLIVADVGDSVLLIQIWADDGELERWLPTAEAFVAGMRAAPAPPMSVVEPGLARFAAEPWPFR